MKYKLFLKPLTMELREHYIKNSHNLDGDAGFDLFFPKAISIPAQSIGKMIDFQVQTEMKKIIIVDGDPIEKPASFLIIPRSSIYKTPLRQANSIGLIDSGYRGNLQAVVDNIGKQTYTTKPYQRLFQIVAPNFESFEVEVVDTLSETERGEGGFGSTDN